MESQSSSTDTLKEVELIVKWSGKEFTLHVDPNDTVEDLKVHLFSLTNVQPPNQKLIGLSKRKLVDDVSPIYNIYFFFPMHWCCDFIHFKISIPFH